VPERYLDDFAVGQVFRSGRIRAEADRIKSFAAEFDPQPFRLDPEAATRTFFRGLVASGWYTAALTMRLLADSELKPAGGIIGLGFDELRWPRPVRPGDELSLQAEVLEVRREGNESGGACRRRPCWLLHDGARVPASDCWRNRD
jgi:acyl dehydratase